MLFGSADLWPISSDPHLWLRHVPRLRLPNLWLLPEARGLPRASVGRRAWGATGVGPARRCARACPPACARTLRSTKPRTRTSPGHARAPPPTSRAAFAQMNGNDEEAARAMGLVESWAQAPLLVPVGATRGPRRSATFGGSYLDCLFSCLAFVLLAFRLNLRVCVSIWVTSFRCARTCVCLHVVFA